MLLRTTIERRLYTRVETILPVKIFYNDVFIGKCNTINVGIGGILIKMQDIAFTRNSLVQVQFDINLLNGFDDPRIPAVVSRCDNNKVALAFERLEKTIEDFLLLTK